MRVRIWIKIVIILLFIFKFVIFVIEIYLMKLFWVSWWIFLLFQGQINFILRWFTWMRITAYSPLISFIEKLELPLLLESRIFILIGIFIMAFIMFISNLLLLAIQIQWLTFFTFSFTALFVIVISEINFTITRNLFFLLIFTF